MVAEPPSDAGLRRRFPPRWMNAAASLLALFLVVAGARWWLVQNYSTPLPYVDQWDGEAAAVLKPWVEGHLRFRDLFVPHNEHRIFLSRALCLGIFAGNGQWDGQLEAAVNAGWCGAFAVLIAGGLIRVFGEGWRWLILAAVAVCDALPFGWENTLSGFQSQNYFLIIFSLGAIWGMGLHRAGEAGWWIGLAAAGLACLSMGSGFLAAVVVLAWVVLRGVTGRVGAGWGDGVTAVLCGGIVAAGWLTRTVVPGHAVLRADSPAAFGRAFGRFLAWPWYDDAASVWWMAAPLLVLAAVRWHRALAARGEPRGGGPEQRREGDPRAELLLAVGGWCVLQVAALAYTRDGHGAPPACRYMDLLAIFPLTNFLAAALLMTDFTGATGGRRAGAAVVAGGWLALLGTGLWRETAKDFRGWLPDYLAAQRRSEENARGYLRTGDFARYLAGKGPGEIAFPRAERLAQLLDDPTIRGFLPFDVRVPLRLTVEQESKGTVFVPDGVPPTLTVPPWTRAWGSFSDGAGTARGRIEQAGTGAALPYLQWRFAGDLGEPGVAFILSDGAGAQRVDWKPTHVPHERWRVDYVRRPGREVRWEASAGKGGGWFAFTEPVEVGGWSYRAGYVLRRAGWVFAAGWGLALGAVVAEAGWRRWGESSGVAGGDGPGRSVRRRWQPG